MYEKVLGSYLASLLSCFLAPPDFLLLRFLAFSCPTESDDQASTARETDAVDSSRAKRATAAIMATALRSEGVGRLRMLVPA